MLDPLLTCDAAHMTIALLDAILANGSNSPAGSRAKERGSKQGENYDYVEREILGSRAPPNRGRDTRRQCPKLSPARSGRHFPGVIEPATCPRSPGPVLPAVCSTALSAYSHSALVGRAFDRRPDRRR